ncbi:MAG: hypothetical protein ABR548_14760 [Actinomycetota bacterium]|nr:hypothetical protein [Actinomycetota bacterium]
MAARVVTMNEVTDRCELCGVTTDGSFRDRTRHLRGSHPMYARGLLFRLAAPGLFLVEILLMALVHAPSWVYMVALFSSFIVLFAGKQWSRAERRKAGARPTIGFKRLVREGGLPFLLVLPMIALLIALLGRS